jgi:hypothetical protein
MLQVIANRSGLFHTTCPFSGIPPPSLSPISTALYSERNKHAAHQIYDLIHSQSHYYEDSDKNLSIGQFREFNSPSAREIKNETERDNSDDAQNEEDHNNQRVVVKRVVGLMEAMEKNKTTVSGGQLKRLAPSEDEECCILSELGK